MNKTVENNIDELIFGFLEHRLSDVDLHKFFDWVNECRENEEYYFALKAVFDQKSNKNFIVEDSWRRLYAKIEAKKKFRKVRFLQISVSVAASLILILSLSVYFIRDVGKSNQEKSLSYGEVTSHTISSGMNVLSVRMSDGTIIKLAPNSTLNYASDYGVVGRMVYLSGEGYFDVAKNTDKPFEVMSGDQRIFVVGTKFNVRSYKSDNELVTTLLEGHIKFRSESMDKNISMKPCEQVRYNNGDKTISVEKISDPWKEIEWTRCVYSFDSVPLKEILERMKNVYNVRFECNDKLILNTEYKVTFYNGEDLDVFLKVIGKMSGLKYAVIGNIVYLS